MLLGPANKYHPMSYAVVSTGTRIKHENHLYETNKKLSKVEQHKTEQFKKEKLFKPVRLPLPLLCQCPVRPEYALAQVHPLRS